jgi:hypothetical protein
VTTLRFGLTTILFLATAACSSSPAPEGTWLARLSGQDAWLGITVKDDEGAAFVCGSEGNLSTHTRWMKTSVENDNAVFTAEGWKLEVNLSEGDAGGQLVEPSGSAVAFDARRTDDTGVEGLFFSDDGCAGGLIVLNGSPSDMPEALGASCTTSGERAQVLPLLPIELTNQGIEVTVESTEGAREFFMKRAIPEEVTP